MGQELDVLEEDSRFAVEVDSSILLVLVTAG